MLQSSMRPQLAGLKLYRIFTKKAIKDLTTSLGPMMYLVDAAAEELKLLQASNNNHWMCKGKRSVAVALALLQQNEIIAVPTDTVYGLVGVVAQNSSIKKLYTIKERDESKPLCICVNHVNDIQKWGVVDHLPHNLLTNILPGPYTVVLKRTPALNPDLNPGINTVGIRVPDFYFLSFVSKVIGPLALTSANVSNKQSSLKPEEFKELWPQLGGIFHHVKIAGSTYSRAGSTIVDLSCPGYYKIVRPGVGNEDLLSTLTKYGLIQRDSDSNFD